MYATPIIISISGTGYGCGKSSVARLMYNELYYKHDRPATICPIVASLKQVACEFGWGGNKDEVGRKFLQDLGTLGRAYNKYLWVECWHRNLPPRQDFIIVDDLRYPEELEYIRALFNNVYHIHVVGAGLGTNDGHESEATEWEVVDYGIINVAAEVSALQERVLDVLKEIRRGTDFVPTLESY